MITYIELYWIYNYIYETCSFSLCHIFDPESIDHFRILGIGSELVYNAWRLVWENIIKRDVLSLKRCISYSFKKTPRISLICKLVPVQYRE